MDEKKTDPNCPEELQISNPDDGTPGGTILSAYIAALKGDGEKNFNGFYSYFAPTQDREFVKTQHWPRILKHVSKYVKDRNSPTISICKTAKVTDKVVRVFVKSNDPGKSNPPVVLTNEYGGWKIDVFTP
ncbi:MAG: hypothetical protein FJ088_05710 [Deltaproteobacteria bacterium]|nr:hypothetical protein [Deltaproteobacteria bacterium]